MAHMNELYRSKTPEQALAHLVEECGEVIAAAGKTFRFGPRSVNPELPPDQREENIDWLKRELDDVEAAIAAFRAMTADYPADVPPDPERHTDYKVTALAPFAPKAQTTFDADGRPDVRPFSAALSMWAACQGPHATVQQAAKAFNATEDVIRAAVADHPWMYLEGDRIGQDGA